MPGGWAAPASSIFHCVRFLLPRGLGAVARAAHRAQPSVPPSRATEQGRPAVGPLAVRMKPRQRYPTARRPLGARTLRRHGSVRPRGGAHPHPPVRAGACTDYCAPLTANWTSGGSSQSARRVPAAMPPETAGTQRAHRRRETRAGSARTARVTAARRAAGSRSKESRSAASGGEQAPRGRAPAGQKKTRGAKQKPHAVKRKGLAAHPLGKRKPAEQQKSLTQ